MAVLDFATDTQSVCGLPKFFIIVILRGATEQCHIVDQVSRAQLRQCLQAGLDYLCAEGEAQEGESLG